MNEKLKEAVEARGGDSLTMLCWYHALAAAARGEIRGFQLVPVEPTEKMADAFAWPADHSFHGAYAAMLKASREEQK